MTNGWQLFSSVVLSRTVGNVSNDYAGTGANSGAFRTPNDRLNGYGRLGLDSPLQIKIGGTYLLPFDIQVGGLFTHFTGYPYTRTLRVTTDITGRPLNAGTVTFNAEPRGTRRLPSQNQVNLNIAKAFALPQNQKLRVMVDIFNVTNQNTTVSVLSLSSSTFGRVTDILPPRFVRFGLRYQF
jgi:hypothetical protein